MQARNITDLLWQAIDGVHNDCGVIASSYLHIGKDEDALTAIKFACAFYPERWTWESQNAVAVIRYDAPAPVSPVAGLNIFVPMATVVAWMEVGNR